MVSPEGMQRAVSFLGGSLDGSWGGRGISGGWPGRQSRPLYVTDTWSCYIRTDLIEILTIDCGVCFKKYILDLEGGGVELNS